MITLKRPVVEIVCAPAISDAEPDKSGQEILAGRTKIYFHEYYFRKWAFPGREKQHIFTPENRAPRLYGRGPNIICENSAQF
jgi:hypothetical protein